MKFKELEQKTIGELEDMLQDTRAKLSALRFELQTKNSADNSQIGKLRRDIARVLTAINKFHYNSESR